MSRAIGRGGRGYIRISVLGSDHRRLNGSTRTEYSTYVSYELDFLERP